ncbi:MAG: glycolate oxidase subunit GlcF [Proteobacteria bacterium]|nr:glycolate oxidase subunit GlcF [Pseudomonadota bacterium]
MQTFIEKEISSTSRGQEAERILRSCVHCGFCTATCPTYQLLGDELDGPRGRIYLIKSMLEGQATSGKTLTHLDRCLTCRACETTCPSGVEYGKLLDIGRHYVEQKVPRVWYQRLYRFVILKTFPYQKRFKFLLRLGQLCRVVLPGYLKKTVPEYVKENKNRVTTEHARKVILFTGRVQPVLAPNINQSTIKLLDYLGVSVIQLKSEQCCGALSHHLSAEEQARQFMRNNIDLYWPLVEQGVEAIVITASGCAVHLKDYGYLLREETEYAAKAKTISGLAKDLSEYISEFDLDKVSKPNRANVAFQNPCTLQHGQQLNGLTEKILTKLGFELLEIENAHLCCGSAGVYSLLQKEISRKLQSEKIKNLEKKKPDLILTANIGCLQHLQQVSSVPIKHWVEEVAALIN